MEGKLPDFSELPSVVWMNILSMLIQQDQVCLLTTCSRMLALGQLRSLWETVKLKFSLHTGRERPETKPSNKGLRGRQVPVTPHIAMPSYQRRMIQFYGHMFRNITISFKCPHSTAINSEDDKALVHLAKVWKARSLRLIVFDDDDEIVPFPVAVLLNCVHLKKLEIVIWPFKCQLDQTYSSTLIDWNYSNTLKYDLRKDTAHAWNLLLSCLERSKMQHNLQTLLLTLSSDSLEKAYCILRHCSLVVASLFPNLQHLQVPVDQLDKMVPLLTSRGHSQLRTLDVYTVHDLDLMTSHVSPADWAKLLATAPKLKIVCTVLSSHGDGSSLSVLPADLPVVAVTISQSSLSSVKHNLSVFQTVADFSQSLKLFSCLDRGMFTPNMETCNEALFSMVTACHRLEHLTYLSPVDCCTILKLASLDRQWKTFQFLKENIHVETTFHSTKKKSAQSWELEMGELCQKVSSRLGHAWKPLADGSYSTVPSLSQPAADLVAKCRDPFKL